MSFNPVALLPTYHNERTLGDVARRVRAAGLPCIVVDDGCLDGTASVCAELLAQAGRDGGPAVTVVRHGRNLGKAAALLSGFGEAQKQGFTHAVTVDTDGQHDPEEIPLLVAAARENPDALILGERGDQVEGGTPWRSLVGRRFSNGLIRLGGGLVVRDSQTGFRVYPVRMAQTLQCRVQRFGFETEILVRLGRAGGRVVRLPITSRYLPAGERVSHFRPWIDSLRWCRMHLALSCEKLAFWKKRPVWPVSHERGHSRPR